MSLIDAVKDACQTIRNSDFALREIDEWADGKPEYVPSAVRLYVRMTAYGPTGASPQEVAAVMRDNEDVADLVDDIIEAVRDAMSY